MSALEICLSIWLGGATVAWALAVIATWRNRVGALRIFLALWKTIWWFPQYAARCLLVVVTFVGWGPYVAQVTWWDTE